jgi:hypothetical protein
MRAATSGGQPSNRPYLPLSHLVAVRASRLNPGAFLVAVLGRESYEYMYARPWNRVIDFYAELVCVGAGAAGLAKLFGKDEVRRNKHSTPMVTRMIFLIC